MLRLMVGRGRTMDAPRRSAVTAVPIGTNAAPAPASTSGMIASRLPGLDGDQHLRPRPLERLIELLAARRVRWGHDLRQHRQLTHRPLRFYRQHREAG